MTGKVARSRHSPGVAEHQQCSARRHTWLSRPPRPASRFTKLLTTKSVCPPPSYFQREYKPCRRRSEASRSPGDGETLFSWGKGRLVLQANRKENRTNPGQSPVQCELPSGLLAPRSQNPVGQEAFPTQSGATAPPAGTRYRRSAGKGCRGPGRGRRHTAGALRRRGAPPSAESLHTPQTIHPPRSGRAFQGRRAARPAPGSVLAMTPPAAENPTRSRHPPLTVRFLARRPRPSAAIARVSAGRAERAWNSPRRADWPGKRARAPAGGRARTRGITPDALTGRGPAPR